MGKNVKKVPALAKSILKVRELFKVQYTASRGYHIIKYGDQASRIQGAKAVTGNSITRLNTVSDTLFKASRSVGVAMAIFSIAQGIYQSVSSMKDALQGSLIAQGFVELSQDIEKAAENLKSAYTQAE